MESGEGDAAAQFRGNYPQKLSQLVDSGKNYTRFLQICRQADREYHLFTVAYIQKGAMEDLI